MYLWEQAAIGIFLTLEEPTREMRTEAVSAGFYHSDWFQKDYPHIQIVTIDELLHGAEIEMPPQIDLFKRAQKVVPPPKEQQVPLPAA